MVKRSKKSVGILKHLGKIVAEIEKQEEKDKKYRKLREKRNKKRKERYERIMNRKSEEE